MSSLDEGVSQFWGCILWRLLQDLLKWKVAICDTVERRRLSQFKGSFKCGLLFLWNER